MRLAHKILECKRAGAKVELGLNEAADSFMKSKNRNRYMEIMVEKECLFEFLDIRRDTQ